MLSSNVCWMYVHAVFKKSILKVQFQISLLADFGSQCYGNDSISSLIIVEPRITDSDFEVRQNHFNP